MNDSHLSVPFFSQTHRRFQLSALTPPSPWRRVARRTSERPIDLSGRRPPYIAMSLPPPQHSRAFRTFTLCSILLSLFPGSITSAVVTLDSIEIFKTHDWLPSTPTVYFQCKGENKTYLPDVKETQVSYAFKGEESWQPLTQFSKKKCKRCGFYEKDLIKSDVFDEWEFCPSDFTNPDGRYKHIKEKELNVTFLCPDCVPLATGVSNHTTVSHDGEKGIHVAVVIIISVVISTVFIIGLFVAYKFWQKRKREQEHAQFLKLFEEGDELEDELGLGPLHGVV